MGPRTRISMITLAFKIAGGEPPVLQIRSFAALAAQEGTGGPNRARGRAGPDSPI